MTTASLTQADVRLREAAVRELDWDPEVDASAIGVTAAEGVVTLTGFIDSYAGKLAAERVVKRARGVRAVANDITVRLSVGRTDADIARDAAQALQLVPALERVQAVVHHGRVTLTGTVDWLFQMRQAEDAVRHIRGILGMFNHITLTVRSGQRDVRRRILRALHHSADVDAQGLGVTVAGDVVTLTGTVGSWMQREAAERAASGAPGITRVDNRIVVASPEPHEVDLEDESC